MKKLAVFGSYNGSSIGDTAILIGMLSSLSRVYGDQCEFIVFTTNFTNIVYESSLFDISNKITEIVVLKNNNLDDSWSGVLKKNINRLYDKLFNSVAMEDAKIVDALVGVDYLYIGGGNIIMDWFPKWPLILQKICDLSKKQGVRYSFVGVGAGPFCTNKGMDILRKCIDGAESAYFRDKKSKTISEKKLNISNSKLGVDLAFGILFNKKSTKVNNRGTLLLNVASVYGSKWPEKDSNKNKRYIEEYSKFVKLVLEKNALFEINILNTNPTVDQEGIDMFLEEFSKIKKRVKINIYNDNNTVYSLMELGLRSDFAIVTRLHAGLIAWKAGCSIKAIAYQPKVRDVLLESNLCKDDAIILLDDLINSKEVSGKAYFDESRKIDDLMNQVDNIFKEIGRL